MCHQSTLPANTRYEKKQRQERFREEEKRVFLEIDRVQSDPDIIYRGSDQGHR